MPVARYRRIADDIHARITRGDWAVGADLPSRRELAGEYGVNEQTMRLAYDLLRRAGVLEGEERRRVFVAHPAAVRTLTDVDAAWPYSSETTDTRPRPATEELAERLGVPVRAQLQHETVECLDPGGRSAMLVSTWWRGRRRPHVRFLAELDTVCLTEEQAHALGLLVDAMAYHVARTRLDEHGAPVETADLILPMDRWRIRLR
ncbi:GntR family transcriptional regulator [Streptomyces sp. SGAir0957]